MKISAIWAQDNCGAIGNGLGMCWRVPADFKHFKNSTIGCPIIMGRTSFEALGKPLPFRENIVVTRQECYKREGIHVVHTLEDAISLAENIIQNSKTDLETCSHAIDYDFSDSLDSLNMPKYEGELEEKRIWITGGSQIYNLAMPFCDELVVTYLYDIKLDSDASNLVYAPEISDTVWEIDWSRSDTKYRDPSGDTRKWKIIYYVRKQ